MLGSLLGELQQKIPHLAKDLSKVSQLRILKEATTLIKNLKIQEEQRKDEKVKQFIQQQWLQYKLKLLMMGKDTSQLTLVDFVNTELKNKTREDILGNFFDKTMASSLADYDEAENVQVYENVQTVDIGVNTDFPDDLGDPIDFPEDVKLKRATWVIKEETGDLVDILD